MTIFSTDISGELKGKEFDATIVSVLAPSNSNPTFKFQVRIPPLHQGIADADLPYAIMSKRLFVGASAGIGWSSCPRVGSQVKVIFDGGTDMSLLIVGEPAGKAQLVAGFGVGDYGYTDQYGNTFKVDSAGNLAYTTAHNITVTSNGGVVQINANGAQVQIDASGVVTINAPSQIKMTAPTVTVDGQLVVTGAATMQAGATITGGGTLSGGLTVDSADIGGIPFGSHVHDGVQNGGGSTSGPV